MLAAADPALADAYHPATVDALMYEGQMWGVPLAFKCLALYYNRAIIASPPADTAALLEEATRQAAEGRYALAYQATEAYYHAAWMYGFGGGLFDGEEVVDWVTLADF